MIKKKKHQVPWKIPIKRENIDIFYAAPQWQVTHYPIWGEISGVLRSPVVYVATEEHWVTRSLKRPKKTSSGLISHVYVSKSSIFWGITWFFISNFNDQSEWVREMMLVWRRSANKTRTHCYWISSVDEGVLRFFFSTLSSFPLSRVVRNSATVYQPSHWIYHGVL